MAMLLTEELGKRGSTRPFMILASDVNRAALARARQGIYAAGVALPLGEARLERFFHPHERGYQIHQELRETVLFTPQNLIADPPFSRVDLISCRNLLIYLNRRPSSGCSSCSTSRLIRCATCFWGAPRVPIPIPPSFGKCREPGAFTSAVRSWFRGSPGTGFPPERHAPGIPARQSRRRAQQGICGTGQHHPARGAPCCIGADQLCSPGALCERLDR